MKKNLLLVSVCLFYFLLFISVPTTYGQAIPKQEIKQGPKQRPNIIFLLLEGVRWNAMGAMGNKIIQTPNMDKLAQQGVLFRNAYATTPICQVRRASILTGEYARRHGIWKFHTFFSDRALAETYPMILHRNGYYTGFLGKWGVGNSHGIDYQQGTDKKFTDKEVMSLLKSKFDFWGGWIGQGQYIQKLPNGKTIHSTQRLNEEAINFLKTAPKERPFCLSISFKAAHIQDENKTFIPESRLKSLYQNVTIPKPPTDSEKYFKMLPKFLQNSESRVRYLEYFGNYKGFHHNYTYQKGIKNYYRLVTGIDDVVGNIRRQLKKEGRSGNTIIIITSDHGFLLGDHGLTGKWYGYQESVRVPLIIYDPLTPDSARGRIRNEMALNIDMAPTMLNLAGISIPKQMEGKSLVPLLKGETPQWRDDFLLEHLFNRVHIPMSQGVISKRYAYWEFLNKDYKPFYEQLFDLKKDPLEIHNQARNPKYFGILETLRNRMNSLIQSEK